MNKNGLLVMKAFRIVWKFTLIALDILLTIGSDKRSKPHYSAMKAKHLYDNGLISAHQYRRSLGRDR